MIVRDGSARVPGRRRSRRVRLAAVLCGLTLTAAACGGDDDDDADSTAPPGSVSGGTEPADVAETEETQASEESVAETDATEGTTAGEGTTEDAPEDTQGSPVSYTHLTLPTTERV